jgi:hypothetical protein
VDPYIAHGYPPYLTYKYLIYKRGDAKSAGQRLYLSDDAIDEKELGAKPIKSFAFRIWCTRSTHLDLT